jgi:hypothetical protein
VRCLLPNFGHNCGILKIGVSHGPEISAHDAKFCNKSLR